MIQITEKIISWMADLHNNAIEPGSDRPAFDRPLIGSAAGEDTLFTFFKNDIGPHFYWTPAEALSLAFPKESIQSDDLTVIAWVLPQTAHTRQTHRLAIDMPSVEWSKARHYGEKVNENLRVFVVESLRQEGLQACAPVLLPQWARAHSATYGFSSSWSERHAAHACGLGTFGHSDGLITPAGKAVRVGSVIVRKRNKSVPRAYTQHNQWCLHHATGKCLVCMQRCPADAITAEGHDKIKCKEYIRNVTSVYVEREQLGFQVSSCGLCQTKVPCEAKNPVAKLKKTSISEQ